MLVLAQQPDPLKPHELGKPTEFVISNDEFYLTTGARPVVNFGFSTTPAVIRGSVVLLNTVFDTNESVDYNSVSWDHRPGGEQSARNFANMIRSNPLFNDWAVSVYEDGLWVVRIQYRDEYRFPDSEFVFDGTGVDPDISVTAVNGRTPATNGSRLWYQLWRGSEPVAERKFAAFDEASQARVNFENTAGQIVGATDPSLAWTVPIRDELMTDKLYMKFGTFETGENCEPVFGQSYETPEVEFINAVTQPERYAQFRNYCPEYQMPVSWMSSRQYVVNSCRDSFGWIAIYCGVSSLIRTPDYVFRIVYYDVNDQAVGLPIDNQVFQTGVYRFPYGPANPIHDSRVDTAAYFTIAVAWKSFVNGQGIQYGQTLRVNLTNCNCSQQSVYFLEDLGSWRTLDFERLESLVTEVSGVETLSPTRYMKPGRFNPANEINLAGGIQNTPSSAESVLTLRSPKITRANRPIFEEFLRSPRHIILTQRSDTLLYTGQHIFDIPAIRPIVIDRSSYQLEKRGEVTRLLIPYRYNVPQKIRP